jgi:hypothetical protein
MKKKDTKKVLAYICFFISMKKSTLLSLMNLDAQML